MALNDKLIQNCVAGFFNRFSTKGDFIAKILYILGVKYSMSSGICGSYTYGYGKLDYNGYWQYSLYFDDSSFCDKEITRDVRNSLKEIVDTLDKYGFAESDIKIIMLDEVYDVIPNRSL